MSPDDVEFLVRIAIAVAKVLIPLTLRFGETAIVAMYHTASAAGSFLLSLSLKEVVLLSGFTALSLAGAASLIAPVATTHFIAWTHFETLAKAHTFAASLFHNENTLFEMAYTYAEKTAFIPSPLRKTPILRNALICAIHAGNREAFERILCHLDPESLTADDKIRLLASAFNDAHFLHRLLETGSIKRVASSTKLLSLAIIEKAPDSTISTLLTRGGLIIDSLYCGKTILETLLEQESPSIYTLSLLLAWGANPNCCDRSNPLGLAVKSNNLEAVNILLAHGANKNLPLRVGPFNRTFEHTTSLQTYTLYYAHCSHAIKNLLFPARSTPPPRASYTRSSSSEQSRARPEPASPEPEIRTAKSILTFTKCAAEVRSNVRLGFFGNEKMNAIVAELHKPSPCPYKVLGATSRDSSDVIYKKFRRLSATFHPEKFPESKFPKETANAANRVFLALNAAKEYLAAT